MAFSYDVTFNKEHRKNKTGMFTIFIRVIVDGKVSYFSIGQKLHEKYWTGKANRWVRDNHPFAFEFNALIQKKLNMVQKYQFRQRFFENTITREGLIEYMNKKSDSNIFNDYVKAYMEKVTGKAANTIKKYNTFVTYLDQFNARISFGNLNEALFLDFAAFLKKKGLHDNTALKYFDPFKVITKQAVRDGYLEKDPFQLVRLGLTKERKEEPYRMEIEDIQKFKNWVAPDDRPDLKEVRDNFMFLFYASFYYKDLISLTWDKIIETNDGPCVKAPRAKNGSIYTAPIHAFPEALEILEMQRGKHPQLIFPNLYTEQTFNLKVKDIAEAAGIKEHKKVSIKTARHSSTQFFISQGLPTEIMQKILGHKKPDITQQYHGMNARDINKAVAKLDLTAVNIKTKPNP